MRDARAIKETREAVLAIVKLFDAWQVANADKKLTFLELVEMLRVMPEAWTAIKGAGEIPKELVDLDGLEADELIAMIAAHFNKDIPTPEMRLKIDKILIAFHALLDAAAQWFGVNPPKAQIVP